CCNRGTCWVLRLTGSVRARKRLKNNLNCSLPGGSQHIPHEATIDHNLRGHSSANLRERGFGANHSAGRVTIQPASASTAATAQNRGASGAADGRANNPDLSPGAAPSFQRPHHKLSR